MLGESIPVTLLGTCQILSEADNFDPNEHATELIRSGSHTIPNVRDLIDDADWIADALCDLAEKRGGLCHPLRKPGCRGCGAAR